MKVYNYKDLSKSKIEELCSRQIEDDKLIEERVADIIETVKKMEIKHSLILQKPLTK